MFLLIKKQLISAKRKILLYLAIFFIIVCGMIFYSGFTGALNNINTSINKFYEDMNLADYEINTNAKFNEDELSALINHLDNNSIAYNLIYNETPNDVTSLYHRDNLSINKIDIIEGKAPTNNKEIVLSYTYAKENNYNVGDYLIIRNKAYLLVGIAKFPNHIFIGNVFPDPNNMIALTYEEIKLNNVNTIYLDTNLDKAQIEEIINNFIHSVSFSVTKANSNYSYIRVNDDLRLINAILFIFPITCFISIIIILFINYNRIIDEEKPYIGILKANGYKMFKIYISLLIIPLSLVFIASLIGSILGIYFIPPLYERIILNYYELPTIIQGNIFTSIILPIILLLSTTFITISIPILLIIRKEPINLLKSQAESKFGRTFLRKVKLPYHLKLIIRNIITSKRKNICLVLATSLLLGIVLAVFYVSDSIDYSTNKVNIFNGNYLLNINDNGSIYNNSNSPIEDDYYYYITYTKFNSVNGRNLAVNILDKNKPALNIKNTNNEPLDLSENGVYLASSYQKEGYQIGDEITLYFSVDGYKTPYKLKIAGFFNEVAQVTIIITLDTIKEINPVLYKLAISNPLRLISLKDNFTSNDLTNYIEHNYSNLDNIKINKANNFGDDNLLLIPNDTLYSSIPLSNKEEEYGLSLYHLYSDNTIVINDNLDILNLNVASDELLPNLATNGIYLPLSYKDKIKNNTIDIYLNKKIYTFNIIGYLNSNKAYTTLSYINNFNDLANYYDKNANSNYYKPLENYDEENLYNYLVDNNPYSNYSLEVSSTFTSSKLGLLNDLVNLTKVIANTLAGIIFILLVYNIGVIGLNNRLADIKCFKSAGLKNSKLKHMLSFENIIVVIIGSLLSIPIGIYIASDILNKVYSITDVKIIFYQNILSIIIIILISIILIMLSSFLINKKIEKMNLATLLKGE